MSAGCEQGGISYGRYGIEVLESVNKIFSPYIRVRVKKAMHLKPRPWCVCCHLRSTIPASGLSTVGFNGVGNFENLSGIIPVDSHNQVEMI